MTKTLITREVDRLQRSMRNHLLFGISAVCILFGGVGTWATITEISGAVVAPGRLVVSGNQKKIQHPAGGVITNLKVEDGAHVKAGEILVQLDDTSARARLSIISNALDELDVRRQRLLAEAAGAADFKLTHADADAGAEKIRQVFAQEQTLFAARKAARDSKRLQLQERVKQLQDQATGLQQQADAKQAEIGILAQRMDAIQQLADRKLIVQSRIEDLRREKASLDGERGQFLAGVAEAQGRMSETRLQLAQMDQDMLEEVTRDLRETESKMSELRERRIEADDIVAKLSLRAPEDGVVYRMATHTVGGVAAPGETLMMIVPEHEELKAELRISPTDVDQVFVGQTASVRLAAFDQRTTPETRGKVTFLSPDLVFDAQTQAPYYTAQLELTPLQASTLKLVPGMPVEAFVQTARRSVLSYVVKPLSDQWNRAFREG